MSLTKEQFNSFTRMTNKEILEDIDHRVKCGVPLLRACKEIVEEQGQIGHRLYVESIRKSYNRWKNVPTFKESVTLPSKTKKLGQIFNEAA